MTARANGQSGEDAVIQLLRYGRWNSIRPHVTVHGHIIDIVAEEPVTALEHLIEVKVWATESGTDTVKKAVAVAYDLRELGEQRPYVLYLSHRLGGINGAMIERAERAGVLRARVLTDHAFGETHCPS